MVQGANHVRNRRVRRPRQCVDLIVGGLRKLEYRGYDSAGVAVVGAGGLVGEAGEGEAPEPRRGCSRTPRSRAAPASATPAGRRTAAPPTRTPTRTRTAASRSSTTASSRTTSSSRPPSPAAATGSPPRPTPRSSRTSSPRRSRPARGTSAPRSAPRSAQVQGTYAIAVVSEKRPDEIVAAKNASPLVVGYGEGESFLASDVPAILEHTREVIYLEEGELAVLTAQGIDDRRARAASPCSASRAGSSGARWPPRRTATSTSCTRRSTSSRARWRTRSAAGPRSSRATSCSTGSSCPRTTPARSSASSSSPAAPRGTPASPGGS